MEMTTDPLLMLDRVLQWWAMDTKEMATSVPILSREFIRKDVALSAIVDSYQDLNNTEFLMYSNLIIDKLERDGYLAMTDVGYSGGKPLYSITFEGKLFSQRGGYKKNDETIAAIESRKETYEERLLYGTWAVAIGAIGLVVWEVVKTFYIEKL